MAVAALARLSQDKLTRLDYLKRQDEIMLYNMRIKEFERVAKRQQRIAEQERLNTEQQQRRAYAAEAEIEKHRAKLADLETK